MKHQCSVLYIYHIRVYNCIYIYYVINQNIYMLYDISYIFITAVTSISLFLEWQRHPPVSFSTSIIAGGS